MVISWLCPTTSSSLHKSSFSSWLNKENFQLEKAGHRYRIANNDRRSSAGGTGNDVIGRARLHSDPASDVMITENGVANMSSKNVRFDDVLPPPPLYGTTPGLHGGGIPLSTIRKPVVINCTGSDSDELTTPFTKASPALTSTERYISLG